MGKLNNPRISVPTVLCVHQCLLSVQSCWEQDSSGSGVRCDEQRWPNLNPNPSLFWPYLFFLGNLRDFKWQYYKITLLRVLLKVRFTISCSVPAIDGFFPLSCHLLAVSIICKRRVSERCELPFLSRHHWTAELKDVWTRESGILHFTFI